MSSEHPLPDSSGPPVDKPEVVWHDSLIDRKARETRQGHRGAVVWLTGLSGCGKSTIAHLIDARLHAGGYRSYVLDGDNIRHGLNAGPDRLAHLGVEYARRFGLGFSPEDRRENIRRIAAVAALFADAGVITIVAFVSPYREDRNAAREAIETSGRPGDFVEVFVDAPLEVCESRDPKGLYKKARRGEIRGFTGVDAPYEPPLQPDVHLLSHKRTPEELAEQVIAFLRQAHIIPKTTG